MNDHNVEAVRAIDNPTAIAPTEPWQQLQDAVMKATNRLRACDWRGGTIVTDDDGIRRAIWMLPPVWHDTGGKNLELAFDANGDLMMFASSAGEDRKGRWGDMSNSWKFYLHSASQSDVELAINIVNRIAT